MALIKADDICLNACTGKNIHLCITVWSSRQCVSVSVTFTGTMMDCKIKLL